MISNFSEKASLKTLFLVYILRDGTGKTCSKILRYKILANLQKPIHIYYA